MEDGNMITKKMRENAHKMTFLIMQYPEHSVTQIINLLQMPAIEINTAIWVAEELGYIDKPNEETSIASVLSPPEPFDFGRVEQELETMLVYSFEQLAKKKQDLEENYLSSWTAGYQSQDVMIALARLINNQQIASYTIEDAAIDDAEDATGSEYTFYTLYKNRDKLWGRKQFKIDPLENKK